MSKLTLCSVLVPGLLLASDPAGAWEIARAASPPLERESEGDRDSILQASAKTPSPALSYPSFNSELLDKQLALYLRYLALFGPPDILIVGSSRAVQGVDPVALQVALASQGYPGLKIFNFGINGGTARVVDLQLRQLLTPEQLPRTIVWADGLRAFNSGRSDRTYNAIVASPGYQRLSAGIRPALNPTATSEAPARPAIEPPAPPERAQPPGFRAEPQPSPARVSPAPAPVQQPPAAPPASVSPAPAPVQQPPAAPPASVSPAPANVQQPPAAPPASVSPVPANVQQPPAAPPASVSPAPAPVQQPPAAPAANESPAPANVQQPPANRPAIDPINFLPGMPAIAGEPGATALANYTAVKQVEKVPPSHPVFPSRCNESRGVKSGTRGEGWGESICINKVSSLPERERAGRSLLVSPAVAAGISDREMTGFIAVETRYDPATYYQRFRRVPGQYDGDYTPFRLQGEQSTALQSVAAFARARKIPLVVVNLPLTGDYLDAVRGDREREFQEYMQRMAREHGFIFRDLSRRWLTQYDYFADPSHLNRFGGEAVSRQLAQDRTIPWPAAK